MPPPIVARPIGRWPGAPGLADCCWPCAACAGGGWAGGFCAWLRAAVALANTKRPDTKIEVTIILNRIKFLPPVRTGRNPGFRFVPGCIRCPSSCKHTPCGLGTVVRSMRYSWDERVSSVDSSGRRYRRSSFVRRPIVVRAIAAGPRARHLKVLAVCRGSGLPATAGRSRC